MASSRSDALVVFGVTGDLARDRPDLQICAYDRYRARPVNVRLASAQDCHSYGVLGEANTLIRIRRSKVRQKRSCRGLVEVL
jgi:hypothetical protein